MEDGFNQSNILVLSAYPNTEGRGKKGCVILTDDCCNAIQTLGTWPSLSKPSSLLIDISLTLNNGVSYSFTTTNGINSITPCNIACYDKEIPIWLAPAGAQPSPCIKASLLQTISQCNKTICWTLSIDTATDSVGAAAIGKIVDVGCSRLTGPGCNCHEAFTTYDFTQTDGEDNVYGQSFVASGYYAQDGTITDLDSLQNDSEFPGQHTIILTKGIVIEGDLDSSTTDSCSDRFIKTITTQVGLFPCQIYNFWAAVYARPSCVDLPIIPNVSEGTNIEASNPNNSIIQWTPQLQKATGGVQYFWKVAYANNGISSKVGGNLRFELSKSTPKGEIARATTKDLWKSLKQWASQLEIFDYTEWGITDCDNFFSNKIGNGIITSGELKNSLSDHAARNNMYASTVFIGLGDRCGPYSIFNTPSTGNEYQSTVTPYFEAGIVTQRASPWFGLMFAGRKHNDTSVTDTSCLC
jgi:hypothetical protein